MLIDIKTEKNIRYVKADVGGLYELEKMHPANREVFIEREEDRKELKQPYLCARLTATYYLALDENSKIVGSATLEPDFRARVICFNQACVDDGYRNRGIAKILVDFCLTHTAQKIQKGETTALIFSRFFPDGRAYLAHVIERLNQDYNIPLITTDHLLNPDAPPVFTEKFGPSLPKRPLPAFTP